MKAKILIVATAIMFTSLMAVACGGGQPSGGNEAGKPAAGPEEKVIASTKAGDLTVTLASASGEIRKGENQLSVSFTDESGKPADVGTASLKFHMPAGGMMAEMNDVATLTPAGTSGKYRASVTIEVAGTWEAMLSYQGARGSGQGSVSIVAK